MWAKTKKRKISKARIYKKSLFLDDDELHDAQINDNKVERYLVMVQIQNDQDPLKWITHWEILSTNHLMSINFGIPPYPPEKLQKVEGKKERQEKFTKKIRKIHNPRKTNLKK
ncbi:hypothetical protein RhiirA5_402272 [Rhizophagus irregularis]|uniref:Uncharacterized protein n=1 Tax=Rhizophagus irregularis TaxID=588596 RepID=A0A2N0P7D2_9GLOM|nr:hypothetical protein RhiirA5_402272 [Rhizophagus irregularis]